MFSSLVRWSAAPAKAARTTAPPTVATAVQKLLPASLPPSLATTSGNLYEVLSRSPSGGVGKKVHQGRWALKELKDCYWEVSRTKFKLDGTHGKAWGKLYWKGQCVSEREELIRGGLKYRWREGTS